MKFEKAIKIIINHEILEQMILCVKKAYPSEACGLVFGEIKEVNVRDGFQYHFIGEKFNCIESDRKSTVAFLIENIEELNRIFQEAAHKHNLRLISIFHSHPSGNHPSGVDHHNMELLDDCGNRAFKNQIWTIMDATNYEINGFIYFHKELMQIDLNLK
jgi:proteasome lid subunit RPN8/RPN11